MVVGIIIFSAPSESEDPEALYLSQFFTPEGNDEHATERSWELVRLCCHDEKNTQSVRKEGKEVIEGIFRLPSGKLFSKSKIMIWRVFAATIFLIICEPDENRSLARQFLFSFHSVLCEHYKNPHLASKPKELLLRPEGALALLDQYLPSGQLIFVNTALSKSMRREVEVLLAGKR